MDNEPQGQAAPQGEQTPPSPPQAEAPPAPTPSQQDDGTDWKAEARKWEARAKKDAAQVAAIKNALTEKDAATAQAQAQAEQAQVLALRFRIAYEHGLPPQLAERLSGDTEESITADAKALAALVKPTRGGTDAATGLGKPEQPPTKADPNALLRQLARK